MRCFAAGGVVVAGRSAGEWLLLEAETERAWRPAFPANMVIVWTTGYFELAIEQICRQGRRIDDDVLGHISPAHSENINFFGALEVVRDAELARLGPTGYRPLRVRDTLFRSWRG